MLSISVPRSCVEQETCSSDWETVSALCDDEWDLDFNWSPPDSNSDALHESEEPVAGPSSRPDVNSRFVVHFMLNVRVFCGVQQKICCFA